jgi:RHS repeat-associated protein
LGDQQVQGLDYAYTLHGWLKSINPSWVTDPVSADQYDSDGMSSPTFFARDAYKLNLHYFDDGVYTDYRPIAPPSGCVQGNGIPLAQKNSLYNGNISTMAVNIRSLATSPANTYAGPMLYNYQYDQLNRIVSLDAWSATGTFAPTGSSPMQDYSERFSFDPNGNIMALTRHGTTGYGMPLQMDSLIYKYVYYKIGGGTGEYIPGQAPTSGVDHLTNQLSSIQDGVTGTGYPNDLKNQSAFNYQYDNIGNMTADVQSGITGISGAPGITWNVYGKILSITNSSGTITYTYDALGNRISKNAAGVTTWYVRDATGNVLSVYTQGNSSVNSGALTQTEAHLYGSSRLGILNLNVNCNSLSLPAQNMWVRGSKLFELSNHLGNVLVTISDRKLQHTTDNSTVDYYKPDAINANDYYAFGMQMPGRTFTVASGGNYRYGFNGKENDNEVKGTGEQIDYGMRVYDPRVGRFLSVDPLTGKYPELTPYQYGSNRPIDGVDEDGLEWAPVKDNNQKITGYNWVGYEQDGKPKAGSTSSDVIFNKNGFNWAYSSNAKGKTGEILITPVNQGAVNQSWWTDQSSSYSYTINIKQEANSAGGMDYNTINAQLWNNAGLVKQSELYYPVATLDERIPDREFFFDARSKFGLTAPATNIESDGLGPVDLLLGAGEFKLGEGIETLLAGGLSFRNYKLARGGTETLDFIATFDKEGNSVMQRISTEYHHMFIPQRAQAKYGLPNWLVNNRMNVWKMNTIQHSIIDNFRKQFLRYEMKDRVGLFKEFNLFTTFPR